MHDMNVVYAAAYLAGRLSTVKHRSPSLLSHFLPVHLVADNAALLINETSHIYPAPQLKGPFSPRAS